MIICKCTNVMCTNECKLLNYLNKPNDSQNIFSQQVRMRKGVDKNDDVKNWESFQTAASMSQTENGCAEYASACPQLSLSNLSINSKK